MNDRDRKINVYCYYDKEAEAYDIPFFAMTDLNATRKFIIDVDQKGSVISRFTKEFVLYRLGTYDTHDGSFTVLPKIEVTNGEKILSMK